MRPRQILATTLAVLMLAAPAAFAQYGAADGEWRSFGGDIGSTKYSGLDQIDADNVDSLRIAWRRPSVDPSYLEMDPNLRFSSQSTAAPLIIGGVGYVPNGIGLVEAFDATTGATRWLQRPFGGSDDLRGTGTRGVAYWTDGTDARIISTRSIRAPASRCRASVRTAAYI
jgi:quinoprotein glucose dehydrogenase